MYDATGTTDIIVVVKVQNRSELSTLVKKFLVMEYVERSNTHVVLTPIKEDFDDFPALNITS